VCQTFTGPFGNPYSFSYTPPFCASVRHRSELQQFAAKDLILNANREIGDKARVTPEGKTAYFTRRRSQVRVLPRPALDSMGCISGS
jgi:hypothetical protein